MKERPILFSGPMVKAILDGRKTQTRRVGKCQIESATELGVAYDMHATKGLEAVATYAAFPGKGTARWAICACPYGVPGDRLWVRETFYIDRFDYIDKPLADLPPLEDRRDLYYRADGDCCAQIPECECGEVGKPKWRPSIFMPRWASRITLEVESVRVERLRDISESDARAEGCEIGDQLAESESTENNCSLATTCCESFEYLWDSINKKRGFGWDANPWVFVITFKPAREVIDGAIEELRKAIL